MIMKPRFQAILIIDWTMLSKDIIIRINLTDIMVRHFVTEIYFWLEKVWTLQRKLIRAFLIISTITPRRPLGTTHAWLTWSILSNRWIISNFLPIEPPWNSEKFRKIWLSITSRSIICKKLSEVYHMTNQGRWPK